MATLKDLDPDTIKSFAKAFQEQLVNIQKALEPFKKTLHDLVKVLDEIPEATRTLAEHGWYLPFDLHPATIYNYAYELKKGNSYAVDNEIVSLFDKDIAAIESGLIKKFPNRKAAIEAAIRAHNNKEYYLSIPVFFSQTEGICKDLTGSRFFSLPKGQPATIEWASNYKSNSIMELVLEPLKHTGVTRQKQNLSNPLGINRHDVLHGDSLDYGENKINSYKALSLLNYIGETVYMAKQDILEKENKKGTTTNNKPKPAVRFVTK